MVFDSRRFNSMISLHFSEGKRFHRKLFEILKIPERFACFPLLINPVHIKKTFTVTIPETQIFNILGIHKMFKKQLSKFRNEISLLT